MALRERERSVKLSYKSWENCPAEEAGWLTTNETEQGGAVSETTTDIELTIDQILWWVNENKDKVGNIEIEVDELGRMTFFQNGEDVPLSFTWETVVFTPITMGAYYLGVWLLYVSGLVFG